MTLLGLAIYSERPSKQDKSTIARRKGLAMVLQFTVK
jgi:hypothetical protein